MSERKQRYKYVYATDLKWDKSVGEAWVLRSKDRVCLGVSQTRHRDILYGHVYWTGKSCGSTAIEEAKIFKKKPYRREFDGKVWDVVKVEIREVLVERTYLNEEEEIEEIAEELEQ